MKNENLAYAFKYGSLRSVFPISLAAIFIPVAAIVPILALAWAGSVTEEYVEKDKMDYCLEHGLAYVRPTYDAG